MDRANNRAMTMARAVFLLFLLVVMMFYPLLSEVLFCTDSDYYMQYFINVKSFKRFKP